MKQTLTLLFSLAAAALAAQPWSISPTFGTNGAVHADVALGADVAYDHALLPDGKLLIAGHGYYITSNSYHASFIRLDTVCGALDTTFGAGGMVSVTFEQRTRLWGVAVQPDGKIIGCGMIAPSNASSQQWPGVFRLNADGSVDPTFNGTGYHRTQFNGGSGDLSACFVNADGTITCTAVGFTTGIGAMRFTANGALDLGFGNNGTAVLAVPNHANTATATGLMTPDGAVISIAAYWTGTANDMWIVMAKFLHDGSPDPSFGTGGLVIGPVLVQSSAGTPGTLGAALLPDGRILVGGCVPTNTDGSLVACFLPDGSLDPTYGDNGVSTIVSPSFRLIGAHVVAQADGSSLQFAHFRPNPYSGPAMGACIARDADGTVITSFGNDGVAIADYSGSQDAFLEGLVLPSGRIIGYGEYAPYSMLAARITTDPAADALPAISIDGSDLVTTGTGAFQWYLDGEAIPGATGSAWTPTANGTYTVEMTLSPACTYLSAPFVFTTLGMEEAAANGMRIAGNPVDDALRVDNPGPPLAYALHDAQGRVLQTGLLTTGMNAIGTAGLGNGCYLLRCGHGPVRRIVVQH